MTYDQPIMTNLTATVARAQFYSLIDRAAESSEPIRIIGPRNSAVLVSEQDWNAIQETLHLLSIPGMRQSIRKGLKTPVSKCATSPGW
jgi:PHD/YefM family antitoxin component YafN of YafNO toxin-antitoxin module